MNVLSGQSEDIITPDQLDDSRRALVDRYVNISGVQGVLVGTLIDTREWNVRGLLLDGGVLKVLRFTDPALVDDRQRYSLIGSNIRKISVLTEKYHVWSAGEHDGQFWSLRNYFQMTLDEVQDFTSTDLIESPIAFAGELVQIVNDWSRDGVVHGHLCPQNVSIEKNIPVVLDYGFCAASKELVLSTQAIAPEVKAGELPGPAADVYGLGLVLQYILRHDMNRRQSDLVATMLEDDPKKRPEIQAILPQFLAPSKRDRKLTEDLPPEDRPTFQAEQRRSAEEALEWAKGTVSLSPDIISKIKSTIAGDATPAQMEHLENVLSSNKKKTDENGIAASTTEQQKVATPTPEKVAPPPPQPEAPPPVKEHAPPPIMRDQTPPTVTPDADQKKDGYMFLIGVIALGIGFLWYMGYFGAFSGDTIPYDRYWKSNLPSKMRSVAEAAVRDNNGEAELVIVQDALSGKNRPQVRSEFIRTAFNPAWEKELTPDDRVLALKIGLSGLIPELLGEAPSFEDAHPGVLLAIIGSLRLDEDAQMLQGISTVRLTALPQPYGQSFEVLQDLGYTTADQSSVRALALLLNGQVTRKVLEAYFAGKDSLPQSYGKFKFLYGLVGKNREARSILMSVMKASGGPVTGLLGWFDKSSIADWSKVKDETRMQLMAGDLGAINLQTEQIADLMTFPVQSVAQEAATLLGSRMSREELMSLAFLVSERNPFSRAQTSFIATVLVLDGEEQYSLLSRWFDTGPNAEGVLQLIITRSNIAGLDPVSIEGARYLTSRNWQVGTKLLTRLLSHPEPMVRVLGLSRLDPVNQLDKQLLQAALSRETNQRLREQIELKLGMSDPAATDASSATKNSETTEE